MTTLERRRVAELGETFEAILLALDAVRFGARIDGAERIRNRIESLLDAGTHVFVVGPAEVDAIDQELLARPRGLGRLWLCDRLHGRVALVGRRGASGAVAAGTGPGPALSDPIFRWLERRGVTGSLVLVVGDPFGSADTPASRWRHRVVRGVEAGNNEPRSPHGPALLDILDEQVSRRRNGRVPAIDLDPAWVVELPSDQHLTRAAESLGALANGVIGLRGAREEDGPTSAPMFVASGAYSSGPLPALLRGPIPSAMAVHDAVPDRRILDLRGAALHRISDGSGVRSIRFVSAARTDAIGLRIEGPPPRLERHHVIGSPSAASAVRHVESGPTSSARTLEDDGGGIAIAARDEVRDLDGLRTVERLATFAVIRPGDDVWPGRAAALGELTSLGFDRLLAAHRARWARRWADAAISIGGAPGDELAARFAMFHLLASADSHGETAVGARGLSGPAYGGHVMWDADVFVLPALAATAPGAARAMLEYRWRRLAAARDAAEAVGCRGARFPWESAGDGTDVTPHEGCGPMGTVVPILTGEVEEHITADVAWAAHEYAVWTGDRHFVDGAGRDLVVDTAAYWASRLRFGDDGRGHIDRVMGPDEYHPIVDDNVFTNAMASWNLLLAASVLDGHDRGLARRHRRAAEALEDGYVTSLGIHEQFAGYLDLEPLTMEAVGTPPLAADLVLGAERVARSQIIKQPDVLMAHHLVPSRLRAGSLAADLAFYGPRTAHGSSLSPAVHSILLARSGAPDAALEWFRVAARLDLDDVTGTTSAGLHLATMGGVWQALTYGFLGLRPSASALTVDPHVPDAWEALEVTFRYHGARMKVRATHDRLTVTAARPSPIRVGRHELVVCGRQPTTYDLGSLR